jgi:hypothetical protein
MRHVQVARLTWLLTGLFAGGAVLFAATRPAPETDEPAVAEADAEAAASAFAAHCGECHGPREFPVWAERQPDAAERRAWLDDFLQRHYPPPDEERALVIEHIERSLAEEGG